MKATYETFLPLFKGVYGNWWEEDNFYELYNDEIKEGKEVIYNNDLMFKSIGKSITNHLENNFPFEIKIEYQNFYSPKFYNFYNDSINVSIELNTNDLKSYILNNYFFFAKKIKEDYTSKDGFISSYFNDVEEWAKDTNNFTDFNFNNHYLGELLNIVCEIEEIKEEDAYYDWLSNNNYDYIDLLTKN